MYNIEGIVYNIEGICVRKVHIRFWNILLVTAALRGCEDR